MSKHTLLLGLVVLPVFLMGQDLRVVDSLKRELDDAKVVASMTLLHEISFYESTPDSITKYAKQLILIAEQEQSPAFESRGYLQLGTALRLQGNFDLALKELFKSASLANAGGVQEVEAAAYLAIADVYQFTENDKNALNYYRKAMDSFYQLGDSLNYSIAMLNYGEEHRLNDRLDSALIYFQRSKVIFVKLDYLIGAAYNIGNIGLVLAKKGQYDRAEDNINEAIIILEKLGDRYPIAVYQASLADIYAQRGEYDRAVKYAKSSLNIGIEDGLKEQIRDASFKLSELYKSAGNSDEAYTYLKQYITYRDSINNEETIRKMADLRTEYEVNKKQIEVDLLSEQAKLNRMVTWSAVFIIALLLVLTISLLKIYRIKDRAVRIVRQRRRVIAAQRNQLDEVNKTKDRFFSIISHDIRGPVSNFQGISGLINVLADSKDADGLKQLGSMMESSAKEVSVLLDNLLEWALSQEGKIPYYPEPVELKEVCQTNLSIMLNMAMAKQIDLKGELTESVIVAADRNSVSTIIRNLLSNAIKFTPEGGNVNLKIREEKGMGLILVRDSGIGIPKDKLDKLFQLKGIRSQWGTKGEKGIGLGLSLVREFVELNKGQIEVASEEGKGTTFKVFLPLSKD